MPTVELLKLNKKVALANKESLVCAGAFIDSSSIIPVDSEHFAAWYAIGDKNPAKITITASGGALRNFDINKISTATINEVLAHPNWSMGRKITVDSASMVNKLFELLEAKWLFPNVALDAIIESKSAIHAIIDFKDGASLLQASSPDMKLPIAYAMLNSVDKEIAKPVNWLELRSLEFKEICKNRYPIWELKEFILENPKLGCAFNAANEVAVEMFLNSKIEFGKIEKIVKSVIKRFESYDLNSIDDVCLQDCEARKLAKEFI